jgi:hypothetical protein
LLTFLWLLSGAAFLVALGAFARVRRVSKRLERLSESYWELRYEHGQLRSRIARLEPAPGAYDPARPVPGGYDPAQPVSGDHDPTRLVPGGHDPAQPARGGHQQQPGAQSGATAFVPLSSLKRPNETTLAE